MSADDVDIAEILAYGEQLQHPERFQARPKEKYSVGYGRPPSANRFKPGRSGNPKGRPKGSRNLRASLEKILTDLIPVRQGNRVRRVTRLEAVLMTTLDKALRGDHKSIMVIQNIAKVLNLMDHRPLKLIVDDVSHFTDEELDEFERLLKKASARTVPI